jgi:uncharacterized membrane protein
MRHGSPSPTRLAAGAAALAGLAAAGWLVPLDGAAHPAWRVAGRIHPVIVHFPIVLLWFVPLLELGGRRRPAWHEAAGVLLAAGMIGAYVAVGAGFALAYADGHDGALLTAHLRGGVAVAAGATAAWLLRGGRWPRAYGLATWLTAVVLGWAAHQGGSLTHGEYYLTEGLPPGVRRSLRLAEPPVSEVYAPDTVMAAAIRPMLERHCISCHGATKQKGNYRMDAFASLTAGGASGRPAVVPGNVTGSELLRRLRLPRGDKKAMPPEGQPQPGEAEIKLLEWWVAHGAGRDLTLAAAVERDPGFEEIFQAARPAGAGEIYIPRVGDYSAVASAMASLARELHLSIVPRSKRPGDGLLVQAFNRAEPITADTLRRLAPIAAFVVELDLAGTGVDDAAVPELRAFPHLERLGFARTPVTGATLGELAGLPRLAVINLSDSALTDAGLQALERGKALRTVYTAGSRVSADGVARFLAVRPDCTLP